MPATITEDDVMSDPFFALAFGIIARGRATPKEVVDLSGLPLKTVYRRLARARELGFLALSEEKGGIRPRLHYTLVPSKIRVLYLREVERTLKSAAEKGIKHIRVGEISSKAVAQGMKELETFLHEGLVERYLREYAEKVTQLGVLPRASIVVILTERLSDDLFFVNMTTRQQEFLKQHELAREFAVYWKGIPELLQREGLPVGKEFSAAEMCVRAYRLLTYASAHRPWL